MIAALLATFFALVLGHLVADFPLQTEFIAKHKSWRANNPAAPWFYVMAAHAGTHGAAVWIVTGSPLLALFEFSAHWCVDSAKCAGKTSIHADQALHVACKAAWAVLWAVGIR